MKQKEPQKRTDGDLKELRKLNKIAQDTVKKMDMALSEMESQIQRLSTGNVAHARGNLLNAVRLQQILLRKLDGKEGIVFISGKISGEEYDDCLNKFVEAEVMLVKAGYNVINPMRIVPQEASWREAMNICIPELIKCTHIYKLEDWFNSQGANIEAFIAMNLGINIITPEDL